MTGIVSRQPQETRAALLTSVSHRPWPLPAGRPSIRMRWTNLLFAHWPVAASALRPLLPAGLEVDSCDGSAWIGVVPFRMENIGLFGLPPLTGARAFLEANLRTYVVEPESGQRGVYFFSLDAAHLVAVLAARLWYRLPYFYARMGLRHIQDGSIHYRSRRLFARAPAALRVDYRPVGGTNFAPDALARFLTERYALFTTAGSHIMRADIHHRPWPLEPAEAEFRELSLPAAHGVRLPPIAPLLHFSRTLDVLAWQPRPVIASR